MSGSSHTVPQSGSITGLDNVRTELEPFGQEVLPTQPPEEPQAGESAGRLKSATEPEWQCGVAGQSYEQIPIQCRIAQWESEDLIRVFVSTKTEKNPNRINDYADSPMPETYSAGDKVMSYALKATSKDRKKNKGGARHNIGETQVNVPISFLDTTAIPGADARQSGDELKTNGQDVSRTISPRPLTCIFNINLEVPKEWRNTDTISTIPDDLIPGDYITTRGFLNLLKNQMMKKFENAGAFLVFNNPKLASGTRRGNYNLKYTEKLSGLLGLAGAIVEPGALGISFRDNGQVAYGKVGGGVSDLAEVGVHETGHWFLGNYPGMTEEDIRKI